MHRQKLIGLSILIGLAVASLPLSSQVRPNVSDEQAMALYGDPAYPIERSYPIEQKYGLTLRVRINPAGAVDSVEYSTGDRVLAGLEVQTEAAVRRWRFQPAQLHGRPVSSWQEITFYYMVKPVTIR